jgi:hypothetical protein
MSGTATVQDLLNICADESIDPAKALVVFLTDGEVTLLQTQDADDSEAAGIDAASTIVLVAVDDR